MLKRWAVLFLILCGGAATVHAASIEGSVVKLIDGDSLMFQPFASAAPIEVRMLGIDAPEGCQEGGPQSRQALADYVDGKAVRLVTQGTDTYRRTLATVYVDGVDINERMVAEGYAWSARYKWDKGPYVDKERVAQTLRRGLHAHPGAVMPRDFRRAHGRCQGAAPIVLTPAPATIPAAPAPTAAYRCDGRTRCSQMRSCEEATWFLNHCPGTKMDGNGDGVPCEKQWCR